MQIVGRDLDLAALTDDEVKNLARDAMCSAGTKLEEAASDHELAGLEQTLDRPDMVASMRPCDRILGGNPDPTIALFRSVNGSSEWMCTKTLSKMQGTVDMPSVPRIFPLAAYGMSSGASVMTFSMTG